MMAMLEVISLEHYNPYVLLLEQFLGFTGIVSIFVNAILINCACCLQKDASKCILGALNTSNMFSSVLWLVFGNNRLVLFCNSHRR